MVSTEPQTHVSQGFESFFEAEHVRLYRALLMLTQDTHEAEELMQLAFCAVWERWPRIRGLDDPVGYLFRTALNAFRKARRRTRRAASRALRGSGVSDPLAAADTRHAVRRALAELPERQRAALVLIGVMGYSSEEAGRALGIRPGTVRTLASRARARLSVTLEDVRE